MDICRTALGAKRLTVLALAGAVWGGTACASMIPLSLTGWNADVIAENNAANPLAATDNQVNGYVWYESGAPGSSQGLPVSETFVSAYNLNTTFQFQPYTAENAVINGATLTLAAPSTFNSLAFLTSSYLGGTFSVTLNFSDSSTDTLTGSDVDWTGSSGNVAISHVGLATDNGAWGSYYSGSLYMYEHDFTLSPADEAKTLDSITFTRTGGSGSEELFAVSGVATGASTPEPATFVLLGLGFAGLACGGLKRFSRG